MIKKWFSFVVAVLLLLVSSAAFAQERKIKSVAPAKEKKTKSIDAPAQEGKIKFGIGLQSSVPFWMVGISGIADVSDKASVQGILGFWWGLTEFEARGIYRFKKKDLWNIYGYGAVGMLSHLGIGTATFGAGTGIEANWQGLDRDLPPLWWNVEIGFRVLGSFLSGIGLGLGVHYRF